MPAHHLILDTPFVHGIKNYSQTSDVGSDNILCARTLQAFQKQKENSDRATGKFGRLVV